MLPTQQVRLKLYENISVLIERVLIKRIEGFAEFSEFVKNTFPTNTQKSAEFTESVEKCS